MVTITRDQLYAFCQKGIAQQKVAFKILAKYKYPFFRRLELFLLTEFSADNLSTIEQIIGHPQDHENECYHHEFYRLLEETFGMCSKDSQKAYVDWISRGGEKYRAHA